jgi:TusA-related sulfurtransferase
MSQEIIKADKVIDARGAFCPGPLMDLIKALKKAEKGFVAEVWSKDEGSKKDIPAWANKAKFAEFVAMIEEDGYNRYQVRKIT